MHLTLSPFDWPPQCCSLIHNVCDISSFASVLLLCLTLMPGCFWGYSVTIFFIAMARLIAIFLLWCYSSFLHWSISWWCLNPLQPESTLAISSKILHQMSSILSGPGAHWPRSVPAHHCLWMCMVFPCWSTSFSHPSAPMHLQPISTARGTSVDGS